jgi:hypothetical protein
MIWIAFTLLSASVVKDIDHKQFASYTECVQYIEQLKSVQPKSCFTQYARFKQPKKKKEIKHEHSATVRPSSNSRK